MNQQENNASNLFKQKRDEYLIEIRKKKNTDQIEAKRAKFTRASEQPEPLLNQSSIDYSSLPLNDLASAFITLLQAQNLTDLPNIARAIRIAVSNAEVLPIEELISTGVVPYMISVLRPQFFSEAALLTECSWIIVNILSEDRYVKDMVQLDIIPIAMELLDHQVHDVKENAIWILSNIASDSHEYRMAMLQKNIAGKIGQLFEDKSLGAPIHNCLIWLISNLCMGKPEFSEVAPFLIYLQEFIKNCKKEKVVLRCVHALSYLTNTDDENQIQEIIDMDILDHLILYLKSGNAKLKAPVIRIIANIAAAHDDFLDILINAGFVETLYPLLDDEKPSIRREVSLVYSNFLAGRSLQITAVFMHDHGKILEKLFYMATHDIEEVAEECIFALCNASEGSDTEIRYLVDLGVIPVLVELITKTQREDILKKCLEALKGILDAGSEIGYGPTPQDNPYFIKLAECNGLSVIETLLQFPSADVFNMVEEILREYTDKM